MDSNPTLTPNLHSSSWKKDSYLRKQDQSAMATCDDNPSGSDKCIASSAAPRPLLRIDFWMETRVEDEKDQRPASVRLPEENLFHDSLVISGAKSKRLNPWAAVGSLLLLSLLLLGLVVIPLLHTDTLPTREKLTMLYVPPAGAASNVRVSAPTSSFKTTPTTITIPRVVHRTEEAPSAPVVVAGGVVGGVPGGVVGGIPGGVLVGVLHGNGTAPVLASTPAPAPKRMRVPAPMAEANLVYDVAPKYPPEAGRARIEGTVVLLAVIGKDGTVQDVRVQSGLSVLAQAAIEAVKQWRYRPYLVNGEPVEVDSQITINFNLSKG